MWKKSARARPTEICSAWLVILAVLKCLYGARAQDALNIVQHADLSDDPDYGVTWYFMPDGEGVPRLALLKPYLPEGARVMVPEGNVNFHLYTNTGDQFYNGTEIKGIEKSWTTFDPRNWTKIIIHGWTSNEYSDPVRIIREAYLEYADVNVIMVDWRDIANSWWYFDSAYNTQVVGRTVAQLIDYMMDHMGADLNMIHVIGHSLGAHVAGFTGAYLGGNVARVTGLDPAGPFFNLRGPELRLDPTDGQFVDIIHTAAFTYGVFQDLGHVDFYPNGGVRQPGCTLVSFLRNEGCSHKRAPQYFAESIGNDEFYGYKCDHFEELQNCQCNTVEFEMMGEHVSQFALGGYFVEVNAESRYAKGPKDNNCQNDIENEIIAQ